MKHTIIESGRGRLIVNTIRDKISITAEIDGAGVTLILPLLDASSLACDVSARVRDAKRG